ncbi:MAG: hypothetical protein IT431_12850 [Phycisphaerales bacterium]|nr:hypothetical protein [Phycisphaerales bacterium]
MSRGLTLIEVVAATALLTLIVGASLPIVLAARRDLAAAAPTKDPAARDDFEAAIDDLLLQRRTLGPELLRAPAPLGLRWRSGNTDRAATAELLTTAGAENDDRRSSHCWVAFRADGMEAVRWLRLPNNPAGPTP